MTEQLNAKQPLRLWWKFEWNGNKITHVAVKCNRHYSVLKRFPIEGRNGEPQIDLANALIRDIEEGRVTIKEVINVN